MATEKPRALVVEDEEPIRRLIGVALRKIGFECDLAADGEQAAELAAKSRFDVVVTDLKMPNRNGHALALDLLQRDNRPLIMVYTGVVEPRLATDLLARGVDDILFKPIDFGVLAAKVKAMVDRQTAGTAQAASGDFGNAGIETPVATGESASGSVNLARLGAKLAELSTLLPSSNVAVDVYGITRSNASATQIATALQRDAPLAADVLRLANSSPFNPSGRRVNELKDAVQCIGEKRVGEVATVIQILAASKASELPWFDVELTWRRSIAAGLIVESLIKTGRHQASEEGLLLSTLMHAMGRVVLGTLFPRQYESMIAGCSGNASLQELERNVFPTTHAEAMAHVLATWGLPPGVVLPLKYSLDDFAGLLRLSEPTRTRTELVKVAIVLARLAADRWQPWDLVELPSPWVLKRLRLSKLCDLVRQTRAAIAGLAAFCPAEEASDGTDAPRAKKRPLVYCDVAESSEDLLVELLPAMGFEPQACSVDQLPDVVQPCVINCLGPAGVRFAARGARKNTVIVSDDENRDMFACLAPTISLPATYGGIHGALKKEFKRKAAPQAVAAT